MSSSVPMRPAGTRVATASALSRAARFMSDLNGPAAIADTTTWPWISFAAIRRGRRLGEKARGLGVEVHHLVPAALREFVEIRAPGRARIVDENVELRLV